MTRYQLNDLTNRAISHQMLSEDTTFLTGHFLVFCFLDMLTNAGLL
jgi:hypothetical protein